MGQKPALRFAADRMTRHGHPGDLSLHPGAGPAILRGSATEFAPQLLAAKATARMLPEGTPCTMANGELGVVRYPKRSRIDRRRRRGGFRSPRIDHPTLAAALRSDHRQHALTEPPRRAHAVDLLRYEDHRPVPPTGTTPCDGGLPLGAVRKWP
jgi:hypothetical protein